jgi:predicted phosphodiesterase
MKRTLVVGDVHGCFDELRRLFDKAKVTDGSEIVLVGDLVNKGPSSLEVVRFARINDMAAVMGNHDDYLLRCIAARKKGEAKDFSDAIRKLAKRIDDEDAAWLAERPLFLKLPQHRAVVVHAGLVPGVALDHQARETLLTVRSITPEGTGSKRIDDGEPWAALYRGPSHVYFGHDAVRGLQRWSHATGLDTACVYGGRLTAIDLPAGELVSVASRRAYAEPGRAVQRAARRV